MRKQRYTDAELNRLVLEYHDKVVCVQFAGRRARLVMYGRLTCDFPGAFTLQTMRSWMEFPSSVVDFVDPPTTEVGHLTIHISEPIWWDRVLTCRRIPRRLWTRLSWRLKSWHKSERFYELQLGPYILLWKRRNTEPYYHMTKHIGPFRIHYDITWWHDFKRIWRHLR